MVSVVGPATADNCAVAEVLNDYNNTSDASDTYDVGTTTVTWTVTDIHGNSSRILKTSPSQMMRTQQSQHQQIKLKQQMQVTAQQW